MRWMWFAGVMLFGAGVPQGKAQETKPPAKTKLTGCVTRSAATDQLVLQSEKSCTRVLGKADPAKLVNHEVTLEGVFRAATAKEPESIEVSGVSRVGEACSATCTLESPGKRGLRKKEKPAGDASTPGAQPTVPKPPER